MNVFIDTQDMEERYAEDLYKEYLEKENKQLKQQLEAYENMRKEAIEYLKKWGNEPDADMYMQIKEYNEYKYLLNILNKVGDSNE